MKIGIYDPYLDDIGGGEKYMMTIAECLAKDNTVSVFWDDESVKKALVQRFSIDLSHIDFKPNIFSSTTSQIQRLKASAKYDVIIVLSDGSIPVLLSKKTFLHVQQPLPFSSISLFDWVKLRRIHGVFCNSEFTKKYTDKRFKVKSKLLYPPIILKPKKLKKENIILHVGRYRVQDSATDMRDFKKQKEMLSAFCEMVDKKKITNWKMVLCASVKDEDIKSFESLKKMTKRYPVEFELNRSNDELWQFYSKSKIYWHASGFGEDLEKHPDRAEHFGISTVEAMGAGAVPIVINCGGQKEIVKENVNGFLWDSLSDLQEKTYKLMHDEKKIAVMSMEARNRAKEFEEINFCKTLTSTLGLNEK